MNEPLDQRPEDGPLPALMDELHELTYTYQCMDYADQQGVRGDRLASRIVEVNARIEAIRDSNRVSFAYRVWAQSQTVGSYVLRGIALLRELYLERIERITLYKIILAYCVGIIFAVFYSS